jgi:hypothetical protein
MLKALYNFEYSALNMAPPVLVLTGLVLVGIGLCVWLGGLRWSRVVGGFIGAIGAGLCGVVFVKNQQVFAGSIAALVGASLGSVMHKTVMVLAGAVVVVLIGLIVFSTPFLPDESNWQTGSEQVNSLTASEGTLSGQESVNLLKEQLTLLFIGMKNCISQVKPMGFIAAIVAGFVVIGCGIAASRFVVSAISATLGTVLIFAGMIFLLLYKGAEPMTQIYSAIGFYGAVMLVMICFGTAVGLLVCPDTGRKPSSKKDDNGDKQ